MWAINCRCAGVAHSCATLVLLIKINNSQCFKHLKSAGLRDERVGTRTHHFFYRLAPFKTQLLPYAFYLASPRHTSPRHIVITSPHYSLRSLQTPTTDAESEHADSQGKQPLPLTSFFLFFRHIFAAYTNSYGSPQWRLLAAPHFPSPPPIASPPVAAYVHCLA